MLLRTSDSAPAVAPASPTVLAVARPASRRFRLVRAYAAALRVAFSYFVFEVLAWVRGRKWARARRPALHARNGRRVRMAILRLRGLFIKAGQLASVLTNFLPEPFRDELEGLQDQVPAGPLVHVRRRIEAELGALPETLFATFDAQPIASASLAQVHRATLEDGRAVAVKVQHADIEAIARLDLRAIQTILRVVGRWFGIRGLREQLAQIEAIILDELDFAQEARNLAAIAERLGGHPGVDVPHVVPERSSQRVLTTTFMEGVKANDLAAIERLGLDRKQIALRIMETYSRLIFRDGLYHADPHPGNLLVQADGTVVFLDFGAIARLTPAMQRGLAAFLMGVMNRDASRVTEALGTMGFVPTGNAAPKAVLELVNGIHERVLGGMDPWSFSLGDVGPAFVQQAHAQTFDDMRALDVSFRDLAGAFQVPRDWILLERTVLLLLGLCTTLDPTINPFKVLWPYVEPLAREAAPSPWTLVTDALQDAARTLFGLPATADRALDKLDQGEVEVQVPALRDQTAVLVAIGRQVVYTLGALGTGAFATVAHLGGDTLLAVGWGLGCGVLFTALLVSMRRLRRGA
ncbi:MAG: AarF/ABC1/UbiB kinase family protein [Rhodothermaceae bacterium]|nr:AarF/ABC1/UbiB kinase family protein [Rhodothermaceae bacterium]